MKKKYSYIERFWVNKINSPFAEIIMFYGDRKINTLWIAPLFIVFTILDIFLAFPIIKAVNWIVHKKAGMAQ